MGEIIPALARGKQRETVGDGLPEFLDGASSERAQEEFEFREPEFNRIEVRTERGQVPELRPRPFDPFADALETRNVSPSMAPSSNPGAVSPSTRNAAPNVLVSPGYCERIRSLGFLAVSRQGRRKAASRCRVLSAGLPVQDDRDG